MASPMLGGSTSLQARYSHVTQAMRDQLMQDLTGVWLAALVERVELSPHSPVAVLDQLLRGLDEDR
jgi:hypothetical protein